MIIKKNLGVKVSEIDLKSYMDNDPFKASGLSLYDWSPIADELKILDKEIVLNSIKNKWNLVISDFKKLSANYSDTQIDFVYFQLRSQQRLDQQVLLYHQGRDAH